MKKLKASPFLTIAMVAALGVGLSACGSGSGSDDDDQAMVCPAGQIGTYPDCTAPPTPYDTASAAIAMAETPEAAQAAYDAASKDAGVTAPQLASLREKRDARVNALNMAAAAEMRKGLVDAAMCTAATAACRDAHQALVSALQADLDALKASDDATNAEEQAAQMALNEAQTALDEVASALAEIDRTTTTGMAVADAEDAAGGLETDRSAEAIAAAKEAIADAVTEVGDSEDYNDRIAAANMAVARAEELNMVDAAIMAARDAAHGLADDSGVDAVAAAQAEIEAATMAVENAEHLTDAETTAYSRQIADAQAPVTVAKNANDAEAERMRLAEEKAAEETAAEETAAATAAGKALKKALGAMPLGNLGDMDDATAGEQRAALATTGLTVGVPVVPATDPVTFEASPSMKAGTSAGSLGAWKGTNYAHTNPGTKVSNTAIVYTNKASGTTSKPITQTNLGAEANSGLTAPTAGATGILARTITITENTSSRDFKGAGFPTAGTKTFVPGIGGTLLVRGSLKGAPGSYVCATAAGCDVSGNNATITMRSGWTFVHDVGAMLAIADGDYLYFGWWLRKDKDDDPTSASAFTGLVGAGRPTVDLSDSTVISGSATYTGGAAGKFAINDPLTGGDAGHFTADATLTAKFGAVDPPNRGGVSGTLDNFMANDEPVPWSVSLNRAEWEGTAGAFSDEATPANAGDTTADGTTWSIDGNSAAESGSWSGQMYDEKPGNAPTGDGSNVPTSVTGTFQSHFGATHTMVGAFGATKE